MFNKKAGVPFGEITGYLFMVITFTAAMLFFAGCEVKLAKDTKDKIVLSTSEIDAAKALNLFLESPVDKDKKVLDVLIELYIKNSFYGPEREQLTQLDKIIGDFFSNTGITGNILIYDKDNFEIYNSRTYGTGRLVAASDSKIPVSLEKDNLEFIQIIFQLIK